MNVKILYTVFPEIFTQPLFSCSFTVVARPQKLNLRNFSACGNFECVESIATCTWCDFVDTVQLTPDDVSS